MKLQVTKVKTVKCEAKRSHEGNAGSSDACNLKIQSYIHGMERKGKKVIQKSKVMARYMTDIERKELKKFEDELLESLKELRKKIPNYKSEEK